MARDVSTDAVDNMNSIVKIIDKFNFEISETKLKENNIKFGKVPILLPANFYVSTSWYFQKKLAKDQFFNLKVSIVGPDGVSHSGPAQENFVAAGIDRLNVNIQFNALPVTVEGKYTLTVELMSKDGKVLSLGNYPYDVEVTSA